MSEAEEIEVTRSDFIEKVGLIAQAEGLPRIAGRVFGLLVFDGEAVSFSDLATKLQVSRASISTSIRLLEERGVIKRLTKPGMRQDFFQLAANPYQTMLEGIQKRNRITLDDIARTIDSLPEGAEPIARLNEYAQFYAVTDAALGTALQDLGNSPNDQNVPARGLSDE